MKAVRVLFGIFTTIVPSCIYSRLHKSGWINEKSIGIVREENSNKTVGFIPSDSWLFF